MMRGDPIRISNVPPVIKRDDSGQSGRTFGACNETTTINVSPGTQRGLGRIGPGIPVCAACNKSITDILPGTTRSYCEPCSPLRQSSELKKLRSELEMVQSKLQFLRPQKQQDNEPVDGIFKGDVRIVVQGRSREPLYAHKFVLCRRSSVFRKIFTTSLCTLNLEEPGTICIYDASLEAMQAVIKFCYNAEVDFTDEVTVEEIVGVARKYDIELLQKICEENMMATISCENLSKRLMAAKKFELTGLEAAASQFFKDHFDEAFKNVLAEIF